MISHGEIAKETAVALVGILTLELFCPSARRVAAALRFRPTLDGLDNSRLPVWRAPTRRDASLLTFSKTTPNKPMK